MTQTRFFAERDRDGFLVVGEVEYLRDRQATLSFTTALGFVRTETVSRPVYGKVLRQKKLSEDAEDYYWLILENEEPWPGLHSAVVLYFLDGTPFKEKTPYVGPERPWYQRFLDSLLGE